MPVCCVAGCTGKSGHRLPIPVERRAKWLQAIRWTGTQDPPITTIVCHKHFKENDYRKRKPTENDATKNTRLRLRRRSVPSIFDWNDVTAQFDVDRAGETENVRIKFHEGKPVLLEVGEREPSPVRNVGYTVGELSISYDSGDVDVPSQPIRNEPPSPKEDKASLVARTFRAVLAISKNDKETSLVLPTLDGSLVISNAKPLEKPADCGSNSIVDGFVTIQTVEHDGQNETKLRRFQVPVYVRAAEDHVLVKEYVPLMDTSGFNLTNVIVFDATDEGVESLKGQLLELNIQNPEDENESDLPTASISVCELPQDDSPDEDADFFGFSTKDRAISKKLEMIKKANLDLRSRSTPRSSPYSVIKCTSSSLVRPPGPIDLAKEVLASKAVCSVRSKLINSHLGNFVNNFKRKYPNFSMKNTNMKIGAPPRAYCIHGHLKKKPHLRGFRPNILAFRKNDGIHADYTCYNSSKRRDGTLLKNVKEHESVERHRRNNFEKSMSSKKIIGQPVVTDFPAQHSSRTNASENVSDCVSLLDPSSTNADEIEKCRSSNKELCGQSSKAAEHNVPGAIVEKEASAISVSNKKPESASLNCITTLEPQEQTAVLASKGNDFLSGRTTENDVATIDEECSVESYILKDAPSQVEKSNLVSGASTSDCNVRFLGSDGEKAFYVEFDDSDGVVMSVAAENQGIVGGSSCNVEESETNGSSIAAQQTILQNRTDSLDSGCGSQNVTDLENDAVSVEGEQKVSASVNNSCLAFEIVENDSEIVLCDKKVEAHNSVPTESCVDYEIPVQVLDETPDVNEENELCTDENTNLNVQVPNARENNISEIRRSMVPPSLLEHDYTPMRLSVDIPDRSKYVRPKKMRGPRRKHSGYLNLNHWTVTLKRLDPEIVDKYSPPIDKYSMMPYLDGDPTEEADFSDDPSNDDCSIVEQDPLAINQVICYQCSATLPSDAELEQHILLEHADNSSTCLHCYTTFDNVIDWNTHMEEEHPVKESRITYLCPQCDFVTKDNSALRSHIDTEHKVHCNFTCPKCPFKCISNEFLQSHVEKSHSKQHMFVNPYGYVPIIAEPTRHAIETNDLESANSVSNVIQTDPMSYSCMRRTKPRLPVHTNISIMQRSTISQDTETVNEHPNRAQPGAKRIRCLLPVKVLPPAASNPSNVQIVAIQEVSTPRPEVVHYTNHEQPPGRKRFLPQPTILGPIIHIGASHPNMTERLNTPEVPHPETSDVHSNQIGPINNYFPQSPPIAEVGPIHQPTPSEPSVSTELTPIDMNATSEMPQLTQHQCPECTTVLSSYKELGRHLIECHSSKEGHKEQPRIQCNECSRMFYSHIGLRHHMNRKHQNITCPVCKIAFARDYIQHHMKYHNTEYFLCTICNFATTVDAVMQLHKMVIHKKKPQGSISCPVCPPHLTGFSKLSQLEVHSKQRHYAVIIT